MRRPRDERLEQIHRALASGVGPSVLDALWLVQRVHSLQELVRGCDHMLLSTSNILRQQVKLIADCRDGLEPERKG